MSLPRREQLDAYRRADFDLSESGRRPIAMATIRSVWWPLACRGAMPRRSKNRRRVKALDRVWETQTNSQSSAVILIVHCHWPMLQCNMIDDSRTVGSTDAIRG